MAAAVVGLAAAASGAGNLRWQPEAKLLLDAALEQLPFIPRISASRQLQMQVEAANFGMFSVRPEQQGNGIGHRLLAEAERIAGEEWGCREMRMTVIDVREELLAWYLRRGYQRTGEYKPFPYGDERFGIPKRPDLRFELLRKPLG